MTPPTSRASTPLDPLADAVCEAMEQAWWIAPGTGVVQLSEAARTPDARRGAALIAHARGLCIYAHPDDSASPDVRIVGEDWTVTAVTITHHDASGTSIVCFGGRYHGDDTPTCGTVRISHATGISSAMLVYECGDTTHPLMPHDLRIMEVDGTLRAHATGVADDGATYAFTYPCGEFTEPITRDLHVVERDAPVVTAAAVSQQDT